MNLNDLNREQRLGRRKRLKGRFGACGRGIARRAHWTVAQRTCWNDGVPPWAIMAITFTNKAAKEMRERIEKLRYEGRGNLGFDVSFGCAKILRRDIEKLATRVRSPFYDDDDPMSALKEILKS